MFDNNEMINLHLNTFREMQNLLFSTCVVDVEHILNQTQNKNKNTIIIKDC